MVTKAPRLKASARFAAHLYPVVIDHRMICAFLAAALLSVSQMKAQEKAYSVNDLIQQLRSQEKKDRITAAMTLGVMDSEKAKEAVPALIAVLKDREIRVREEAAFALGQIGYEAKNEAKEIVPALIAAIKDQDAGVSRDVAEALGKIGKEAKEAVPPLQ